MEVLLTPPTSNDFDMGIDDVDIVLSLDEFAEQMRAHERNAARLALALRRLENSGEIAADHAVSTGSWLRDRCRMTNESAGRWIKTGRFLDRFPTVSDHALAGSMSAGQVDVMRSFCPPKLRPVMDEQHREFVPTLAPLGIGDTVTVMDEWRAHAEAVVDEGKPPAEPQRHLSADRASDGALLGKFELHGSAAAELEAALSRALTWGGKDDRRTKPEKMADALHDIAAFYNRNQPQPWGKRRRAHVELTLPAADLGSSRLFGHDNETGRLFDHATTETILCDCAIHRILRDGHDMPSGYGRTQYMVPRHLFRLIALRDGGCRFPGCDRPVSYCDAHHLHHWRNGGSTDRDNLGLLCNRHHHIVHRESVEMKVLPGGEMHFTWPDGRHAVTHPPVAPLGDRRRRPG